MSDQLYRICSECDGTGFVGQDMCDVCLATDGPLGLIPVDLEVVTTVTADVSYDDPDPGDQKYSIHADDLPYPGKYHVVCICGRGDE